MQIIAFTGTPGTGKSTLSKEFCKLYNGNYINILDIIKENKLYDTFDKKDDTLDVDINKFINFMIDFIVKKQNLNIECSEFDYLVIDSHLSHFIPNEYIDFVIVCVCDLKILNARLIERNYSKQKIKDNLDSEIFDTIVEEVKEIGHKFTVLNTSKNYIKNSIDQIKDLLKF